MARHIRSVKFFRGTDLQDIEEAINGYLENNTHASNLVDIKLSTNKVGCEIHTTVMIETIKTKC